MPTLKTWDSDECLIAVCSAFHLCSLSKKAVSPLPSKLLMAAMFDALALLGHIGKSSLG